MLKGRKGGDGIYYVNIAAPDYSSAQNEGIAYEVRKCRTLLFSEMGAHGCAGTGVPTLGPDLAMRGRFVSSRMRILPTGAPFPVGLL